MFTVGPFGRLAGVSSKVLRSYDALGLFRPVWVDPASGYRYYSPAQLPALRRILALRELGIGLAEIGRLVDGGSDLRAALVRRRAELERERREIDRRLATLDIRVGSDAGSVESDVVIRPVPAEAVATMALSPRDRVDVGAAFYELEAVVRDLGRRAHRPPGALIRPDSDVEIFVPVTGPVAAPVPGASTRIEYRRLPACRAATVIERGPYEALAAARDRLGQWLMSAGLVPAGPLRIIYLQFGAEPELRVPRPYLVERDADFVTELQQPIA
jgi:DNA-binding transcriptional MerR regulator